MRTLTFCSATIAVLLALSGCAGTPVPTPKASGSSPGSLSTVNPANSDASARPIDRVPLSCDELLGEDELTLAMGIPAASYSARTAPVDTGVVAAVQGGMLRCEWGSSVELGPDVGAAWTRLEILPDAADAYQAQSSTPIDGQATGLVGPNSLVSCFVDGPTRSCNVRFESDGYWGELTFGGLYSSHPENSVMVADAAQIGTAIRDALAEAGSPRPAFTPAADAVKPWASCAIVDADGAFRSALGSPQLEDPTLVSDDATMFSVAEQRSGHVSCDWQHGDDVLNTPAGELRRIGIDTIPGAAWAWPELVTVAVAQNADVEIDVPGADAAVIVCADVNECFVQGLVRGSYVSAHASNEPGNSADARAGAIHALELAIAAL